MIQRTATDPSRFAKRLAFTSSARVGWRLILEGVRLQDGESILLPAYVGVSDREGSGIGDPLQATDTPYTLYSLDDHFRPKLDELESMMKTGCHPLLLVVHYFGIVHVDLLKLRELCERYRTLLIEDCAHVPWPLHNDTGPGSVGHAAFYSLHKSIAVPTGGIVRVNDPGMALPAPDGADRCDYACLEQFLRTDMEFVATKRRSNYQWLANRLAHVDGLTILFPDIGELVPHDFPVLVHDNCREKLYFELMKEGLPTIALYYRLVDSITVAEYPASHEFSSKILNLPVHQDTDQADLERLTDRLVTILDGLRA
jgi:dTDP-4-amino-4,6-dideoxygalactose transaminase